MNIFEIIDDIFHTVSIEIQYFFKTRGKMYKATRSKHGTCLANADNIDAKHFTLKVDFDGQNESPETYVGHDYIVINAESDLVFFRDVVEYMHDTYGDDIKIRSISFITQYTTKYWLNKISGYRGKYDNSIYLTGDEVRDKAIIEKADSIFQEWVENHPKYYEFQQRDWNI